MFFFKAKNSSDGVSVDSQKTPDISSLSGNKTSSDGIVLIKNSTHTYIPNYGKDTALLVKEVGQAFIDLSSVPPINGSGDATTLNPQFSTKLSELGNKIQNLSKELV